MLIIRRSKLHYTDDTIKLVNYWDKYTEMHGQQNVKKFNSCFIYGWADVIRHSYSHYLHLSTGLHPWTSFITNKLHLFAFVWDYYNMFHLFILAIFREHWYTKDILTVCVSFLYISAPWKCLQNIAETFNSIYMYIYVVYQYSCKIAIINSRNMLELR